MGKKVGNLYLLKPVSDFFLVFDFSKICNTVLDQTSLWHARLGHPSNDKTFSNERYFTNWI